MSKLSNICTLLFALLLGGYAAQGQNKFTLSGTVVDASNGETLIGATIRVDSTSKGTITNEYGYYAISLPEGKYQFTVTYLGYQAQSISLSLDQDVTQKFELVRNEVSLTEVEVSAERPTKNVESVEMSTIRMPMAQIKKMPAFLGEVDVIKAIQLLPGVSAAGEGQSGFFVRGGAADQNLILLDEANVYNASHLFGFFSVFNPDAIKDVKLYKGGIPARYGGRLASVLDVRMADGNMKTLAGSGGVGLLSSRLTVEAPIVKDRGSFLVSGRRTYVDLFLRMSNNEEVNNNTLYFYDFNAKANYKINDNNRVFLSGYFGRDVFGIQDDLARIGWGNATATARWNHIFNSKLFSNATFIYSNYDYALGSRENLETFTWSSNIEDLSFKYDLNFFENPKSTWRAGVQVTHHAFQPGTILFEADTADDFEFKLDPSYAIETGVYLEREHEISPRFSMQYGLRWSGLYNIGNVSYGLDENFEVVDTTVNERGKVHNSYGGLEPRLGARYTLTETSSVKASYNRMRQYAQLASNSTASSPLDVWFLASENVKPQIADQIAAGYFRNFKNNTYEASAEVYYKWMQNAIDFKNQANLLLNKQLEAELRTGRAFAYGLELFVRKNEGRLNGFVSYTLSRITKVIDVDQTLEGVEIFPAKYDKTHDIAVALSYDASKRVSLGMNFVYATGLAATFPSGKFFYKGVLVPTYTERNGARYPAYHRLDVSCTLRDKPKLNKRGEPRKFQGEWVFSIYNLYNRHNTYLINFNQNPENPYQGVQAEKFYLFPIIPSVTYNFKF